jgi:hypothetical protein
MSKELKPFEQRLLKERQELSDRFKKLSTFLNNQHTIGVTAKQLELITLQHEVMAEYLNILDQRIEDLGLSDVDVQKTIASSDNPVNN